MKFAKLKTTKIEFNCSPDNWQSYFNTIDAETCPEGYVNFSKVNSSLPQKEGFANVFHCYVSDATLYREWIYVKEEESKSRQYQPPRTFSKLKAVAVLTNAGYWERCKQFITDAGLYDLYLAAQDFREDNEYFTQGLAQIKTELGLTDEQVEAILAQCVAD